MGSRSERAKATIKGVVAPDAAAAQKSGISNAPVGTPNNPSNAVLTIPNIITLCRFVLTIAFLVLFVRHETQTRGIALACYAVAACTDFLDGFIARRTQTVSWFGKIMDPIMDRVLLFTGVLGLMFTGELPVWVAAFVVGRDTVLAAGSIWLRKFQKRPLDVIYVGKAATALLMGGFVDLLLAVPVVQGLGLVDVPWLPGLNHEPVAVGMFLVYVGLVCSTLAAIIYYIKGLHIRSAYLKKMAAEKKTHV